MPRLAKKKLSDSVESKIKQTRSLAANGYYSLLTRKDSLYAVLVRSPVISGKIKSITCPELPKDYFLFTADDIPGKNFLEINHIKIKIFGFDNIGYNGEPLGILVGPDETKLQELLSQISFNFDIETLESAVQQIITHEEKDLTKLPLGEAVVPEINSAADNQDNSDETENKSETNSEIKSSENSEQTTENESESTVESEKIDGSDSDTESNSEAKEISDSDFIDISSPDFAESENPEDQSKEKLSDFVDFINEMPSLNTILDKTHVEENPYQVVAKREVKTGVYNLNLNNNDSQNPADSNPETTNVYNETYLEANKIFETAAYTVKNTWNQKLVNPKWHEPDGAFCYMEAGNLKVNTPTKWTSNLHNAIQQVLDIPTEKIFINKTKSSGLYPNGLWRTNILAVQVALATYLTKKPVKLILSPNEQNLYMGPGVNTDITYEAAVSETGQIQALKAFIDIDLGMANPFAQEITDRMAIAVCNFYRTENLFIQAQAHTSKNPPTTIHLKCVDSQVLFATECLMETIASKTNLFPDEIRAINSEFTAKQEKNSKFPFNVELPNIKETITKAIKQSDFNRKYASFQMDAIDRVEKDSRPFFALPLRGIGFASAYNISGYCGVSNFAYDSKIEITLTSENKVLIHAIKPSEVIQQIWKQTASEILQLPVENIEILSDFPLNDLPKAPEDTFSTIGIINELVKKCCAEIQRKRFHNPLPITSKKALSTVMKKNWDSKNFSGTPFHTTSSCTTVLEVELDNYTYSQKIKGIWIIVDCGEIFDESAATRAIKLEVQQELATLVEGKSVQYENLHIDYVRNGRKSGQVGELIHNTLPAAFASAMSLALTTQITQLPVTEKQIYNLIKKRSTRGEN